MLQSKPSRRRRVRPSLSTRARLVDGCIRLEERDRFVAAGVISLRLR
ncbi:MULTISPECIES: hypothetical protein [Aeromicrobium]|nr:MULTISPECIES: hypothetical protein [Aeromicrobium]